MTDESLFAAALDLADPAARAALLDAACPDDPARRQLLAELLDAHASAGTTFLERAAVTPPAPAADDPLAGLPPPAAAGAVGRLDHYDVLGVVGRGGMGVVYRAFDTRLRRAVALKRMAPALAADPAARGRFVREAQAAAGIRDDHVVTVYAVHDDGPVPYLVMEFVGGGSLQQAVARAGRLPPAEVARVGAEAARGLAAAHARGLVHGDVKPANILFEEATGRVKLTDFGLARWGDDPAGGPSGTPAYMAPEQAPGRAADHRADLFGLGCVLYELATGAKAYPAATVTGVLRGAARPRPRPVREVNPAVPRGLADLIGRLMADDPAARPASAAAAAAELDALRAGRPRRWPTVAAGAVLAAGAVAVAFWPPREEPPESPPVAARTAPEPGPEAVPEAAQAAFTNALGMRFARVPAGRGWVRPALHKEDDTPPAREVTFPADFFLGQFEVTQAEWRAVMGADPSAYSRAGPDAATVERVGDDELARLPVESVSWDDVQRFLEKLNAATPEPGWVYRLPTPDEWEYACRGGPMTDPKEAAFDFYLHEPVRGRLRPEQANFRHGLCPNRPCRVGSYLPNALGLYDLHGNVAEWCDRPAGGGDPLVKGESWDRIPRGQGAGWSEARPAGTKDAALGFRVVRAPGPDGR